MISRCVARVNRETWCAFRALSKAQLVPRSALVHRRFNAIRRRMLDNESNMAILNLSRSAARSLIARTSAAFLIFAGFFLVFFAVAPKLPGSSSAANSGVAHADAPYGQGAYYSQGGYGGDGKGCGSSDGDCGQASDSAGAGCGCDSCSGCVGDSCF